MPDKMTPEEVAILIRARGIARENGLNPDADVSAICKAVGISRKTGYEWAGKYFGKMVENESLSEQLERLREDRDKLKRELEDAGFENRGLKLAWEIHHVDEWLASKKSASGKGSGKKP